MALFPATNPVEIRNDDEIRQLEVYLRRSSRDRVLVVVTVDPEYGEPFVDPRALFDHYAADGEGIDVATIRTVALTKALARRIGNERSVYQGAIRVYPCDDAWMEPGRYRESHLCLQHSSNVHVYELFVRNTIDAAIRRKKELEETSSAAPDVRGPADGRALVGDGAVSAPQPSEMVVTPNNTAAQTAGAAEPGDAIAQSGSAQSGSIQTGTSPFAMTAQSNSSQYEPLEPYDTMTGTAIAISDADEAEALSEYLTSPDRQHPAVVVTRRFGKPLFDAKSLASNLHDVAAVFDLVTPKATWGLSAALPEGTRVYNGSARVYPPGIDWVDNPSTLPYYVGWSDAELKTLTETIIATAIGKEARNYSSADAMRKPEIVEMTIAGIYNGRAIAQLPGGGLASAVLPERYGQYVYDRVLRKGQKVRGELNPQSRIVMILPDPQTPQQAIEAYASGQTVLAHATKVNARRCIVELFPGVTIRMDAKDETGICDMRDLVSPDTVIPIYIGVKGTVSDEEYQRDWLLSIADANVSDIRPAPALLRLGPPWLDSADMKKAVVPAGDTAMTRTQFDSMQELVEFITDDDGHIDESAADEVFQYLTQLQGEARHLREGLKVSNGRLESMKQKMMQKQRENSYSDGRQYYKSPLPLFADKAEGKRFEREQMDMLVRREWATRFGPEEKKSHALPRTWAYSDWFFDTLASTHISVSKVVAVMVEVLTGLDIELAGRQNHRLRTGSGGDDPYRLGPNGEICFRDSLQVGQAAARRLHYMRSADNTVTFTSVRTHDDFAL